MAVADKLVTELHCRWGLPEMMVSNRGGKFRNWLMKHHHMFGLGCNMPAVGGMLGRMEEAPGLNEGMNEGTRRDQTV